jgi:hypothetical protein
MGPELIARGASPWYAGALTLEYKSALNRAEVPLPGREAKNCSRRCSPGTVFLDANVGDLRVSRRSRQAFQEVISVEKASNLAILMNKKDGTFLIRNFAIDPRYGYRAEFGELVPVDIESMRTRGLEIVLENLETFFERDALRDLNERPRHPREESLKLDRATYEVAVALAGHELCLDPMKRVGKGSSVGIECPAMTMDARSTNEEFFQLLATAFSICRIHDEKAT